jgi:hypothetical protein
MQNLNFTLAQPYQTRYDNDVDALTPEVWAHESIAFLEENMVIGQLVHRDYSDEIAKMGDTVNIDKPADFKAKRKGVNDDVTIQDANASNVPVKLDQHIHTSFLIRDGEESVAIESLVDKYLEPALIAQARLLDQVLLGQTVQFVNNSYGTLGGLTGSNAKESILGVRKILNTNKAHMSNRHMIWTVEGETAALNTDLFLTADKVGDDGTALREASLGRKLGFNHFMSQNSSEFVDSASIGEVAVNKIGGYSKGATEIDIDGTEAGDITANMWVKIEGVVYRVLSNVAGTMTLTTGLKTPVADDAVVSGFAAGAVNNASGYAAGFGKYIAVDGAASYEVGQFISFGNLAGAAAYSIVDVEGDTLMLDRPLEAAIVDDQVVNVAPGGSYNFAFHRNSLALVTRPLAMPKTGTGALSAIVSHNGYVMRATITYNGTKQGHLVTLDMLAGVKVLDTDLGAVLLG